MKVYDTFADKYIDESEIEIIAPPERYVPLSEDLLVKNAVRWFLKHYKAERKERSDGHDTVSL